MKKAVELHHEIIRGLIEEHCAYEVKTVGDSFMIAVSSLCDGAMLALAIQRKLFEAPWPSSLRYWKGESPNSSCWCGLRVRIGIHLCQEVEAKYDVVHSCYDYYGHDVNVTARVEGVAQGGQILMTSDTLTFLRADPDSEALVFAESVLTQVSSGIELKGVSTSVQLWSLVPKQLAAREFEPIEGHVEADLSRSGSHTNSQIQMLKMGETTSSDTGSTAGDPGHRAALRVLRGFLTSVSPQEMRERVLKIVAEKLKLPSHNVPFARRLMQVCQKLEGM